MYRHEITIPGYIYEISAEDKNDVLKLFRLFGSTRRRMYNMKWKKGFDRNTCVHNLSDVGLNTRYLRDAWYTIEHLPPHVTFGGKNNQRLREQDKITKEQWEERRNSIVLSKGDKSKSGSLNMRIIEENGNYKLRVNIPFSKNKYAYMGLYIPKKYLKKYGKYLNGENPYTVTLKRENGEIYAKISLVVPYEKKESKRVMAIDTNAGHVDFAVMDKENGKLIAVGKANTEQRDEYIVSEKLSNVANHYDADVVIGKLDSHKFKGKNFAGCHKVNRKINQIQHKKLRTALKKKLTEKGRDLRVRSEAYTTQVGRKLSPRIGLDIHKSSAIALGLKLVSYETFQYLQGVRMNEGSGSLSAERSAGCGITSLCQGSGALAYDEAVRDSGGYAQIPGMGGIDALASMIKADLRCLIKIP